MQIKLQIFPLIFQFSYAKWILEEFLLNKIFLISKKKLSFKNKLHMSQINNKFILMNEYIGISEICGKYVVHIQNNIVVNV